MSLFSAGGKRRRRESGWSADYGAAEAEGWRESQVGGEMREVKVSWPIAATWKEGRSQGVPRKKKRVLGLAGDAHTCPTWAAHESEEMLSSCRGTQITAG